MAEDLAPRGRKGSDMHKEDAALRSAAAVVLRQYQDRRDMRDAMHALDEALEAGM
jgi:hypothetical protein